MSDNRSRKKRKSNASYVLEILLCLIALTAIIFAMLFLVRSHNLEDRVNELQDRIDIYEDPADPYIPTSRAEAMILDQKDENYAVAYNEGRYKLLNDMKQTLLDSDSVLKTFQKFYPDDLIIYYEGDYLFYPISQQLRHHTYDNSLFNSLDNGRIAYVSSDVSTETWIDVSKFQGKVKWSEVAKDGIDGTMIRIGYRGYSKGDIMMDDTFEDNIEGALKNDLQAGVYFLSQAISEEEAVEEAEYVIEIPMKEKLDRKTCDSMCGEYLGQDQILALKKQKKKPEPVLIDIKPKIRDLKLQEQGSGFLFPRWLPEPVPAYFFRNPQSHSYRMWQRGSQSYRKNHTVP